MNQIPKANYLILLKFTDGETLKMSFENYKSALEFHRRAQNRADTAYAQFIDLELTGESRF